MKPDELKAIKKYLEILNKILNKGDIKYLIDRIDEELLKL